MANAHRAQPHLQAGRGSETKGLTAMNQSHRQTVFLISSSSAAQISSIRRVLDMFADRTLHSVFRHLNGKKRYVGLKLDLVLNPSVVITVYNMNSYFQLKSLIYFQTNKLLIALIMPIIKTINIT